MASGEDDKAKGQSARSIPSANKPPEAAEPEQFDPEGWMSERPLYWLQLPEIETPTRSAWLRHRAREFASWLHLAERKRDPQITEEQWIALSEQALGPLPRPGKAPPKKTRPATPNAGKSARKPAACSQSRAPGVGPR